MMVSSAELTPSIHRSPWLLLLPQYPRTEGLSSWQRQGAAVHLATG